MSESGPRPRKRQLIFHPWALAAYSILSLAAANIQQIPLSEALRPLVWSLVGSALLVGILRLLTGSWLKAGVVTSLFLLLFFSYGRAYDLVKNASLGGVLLGRHRYLSLVWLVFLGSFSWWVWRAPADRLRPINSFLNIACLIAVAFPIFSMARLGVLSSRAAFVRPASSESRALHWDGPGQPPDVYYIILDSYAREDIMRDLYGFDNHAFIQALRQRGFYVADKSDANHVSTAFSLASSLNMATLPDLGIDLPPGTYPAPLTDPIRNSLVRQQFEKLGYRTVALSSGWAPTSIINADVFLKPGQDSLDQSRSRYPQPTAFESFLLSTTWLRFPLDALEARQLSALAQSLDVLQGNEAQRQLVLWSFDQLERIPPLQGPKFVFAHFVSPHRPYLFGPNGERTPSSGAFNFEDSNPTTDAVQEFGEYRDQLLYINQRTLEMLDVLIKDSSTDPIIVLQSDTGPAFGFDWKHPDQKNLLTKIGILNAYHVPQECDSRLYPTISPANSFRLVFDCVYGGSYALRPDKTYYSDHHSSSGYEFTPIEELLTPTPVGP
ncbi:MAG: hypothetical protein WBZ24_14280 [Anaerolineales bacterium]|jgi:hypothetical protein